MKYYLKLTTKFLTISLLYAILCIVNKERDFLLGGIKLANVVQKITHKEIEDFYDTETSIDFGELKFGGYHSMSFHDEMFLKYIFYDIIMHKIEEIRNRFNLSDDFPLSFHSVAIDITGAQGYIFHSNIKYSLVLTVKVDGYYSIRDFEGEENFTVEL